MEKPTKPAGNGSGMQGELEKPGLLERLFKLTKNNTNIKTEVIAGASTFMTMSYIFFVQPTVLAAGGMDFGSVMVATCVSSAFATFVLGLLANYPIALAPAMGHNFFFTYIVVIGMGIPWQKALGAVFISGSLFLLLSFFGFREKIVDAIPTSLKNGIAVGIGLLIALVGFQWAGMVVATPGTIVGLGDLKSPPVLLAIFGTMVIGSLMALKIKGAILWGIILTTVAGIPLGIVKYHGMVSNVPSISPTFFKLDIVGAFELGLVTVIFIFFFLDLFDTIGTLVGVSEQAGFMRDGKLPRARQALFSDALGTVTGAVLGTSTVTSYIESAAGVSEGGRTGLANMVTGVLMLLVLLFSPLAQMIGEGYAVSENVRLYPVVAPALIIVGSLMMKNVLKIEWNEPTECIPAFLTLITMPFAFGITEGIAFGFISYSVLKLITGRFKQAHWIVHMFAILFILRYAFLKG